MWIILLAATFNFCLNLALIPVYRQNGAAGATLISEVLVLFLMLQTMGWRQVRVWAGAGDVAAFAGRPAELWSRAGIGCVANQFFCRIGIDGPGILFLYDLHRCPFPGRVAGGLGFNHLETQRIGSRVRWNSAWPFPGQRREILAGNLSDL